MRNPDAENSTTPETGLAHFLPTQIISFSDSHGVHSFTLSPVKRLGLVLGGVTLAIWGVIATMTLVLNSSADTKMRLRSAALTMAYESRLEALRDERDLLVTQLDKTTARMQIAQTQLLAQQESILQIGAERQEMDAQIGATQQQLEAALISRDTAAQQANRLQTQFASLQALMTERLGGQQDEVAVVTSMTAALADAVQARDMEFEKVAELRTELDNLELQRNLNAQRQDRMLNQLEDALTVSMVPLSNMFEAAGLDVDSLLANVRQNYSGTGGLSDERAEALPAFDSRVQGILAQLDDLASLNAAAARIPLVNPVHSGYRLSSPFGPRGGRLHKGLDMASSLNTPIYASADATVKFSGTQSGYGNVVVLDHGGGYETYYAHLNRRLVTVGQTISRGD
jgi:murein DD-endopeptidase MepM/ murein hydrolase activator NlpD